MTRLAEVLYPILLEVRQWKRPGVRVVRVAECRDQLCVWPIATVAVAGATVMSHRYVGFSVTVTAAERLPFTERRDARRSRASHRGHDTTVTD